MIGVVLYGVEADNGAIREGQLLADVTRLCVGIACIVILGWAMRMGPLDYGLDALWASLGINASDPVLRNRQLAKFGRRPPSSSRVLAAFEDVVTGLSRACVPRACGGLECSRLSDWVNFGTDLELPRVVAGFWRLCWFC